MEINKCFVPKCNHNCTTCKLYTVSIEKENGRTRADSFISEEIERRLVCRCHLRGEDPLEDLGTALSAALPSSPTESGGEIQVPTVSSCLQSSRKGIKRSDYIDWEEYFMATALLAAKRSKDPVTQVGACLANRRNVVVGIGYNGMPNGLHDDEFPWGKSPEIMESKHTFVCHAELNAVLNANCVDLSDCTLYVSLFPCNECAKVIIQARIKRLIYLSDKHAKKDTTLAAKCMFEAAGVTFKAFEPRRSKIEIDFSSSS